MAVCQRSLLKIPSVVTYKCISPLYQWKIYVKKTCICLDKSHFFIINICLVNGMWYISSSLLLSLISTHYALEKCFLCIITVAYELLTLTAGQFYVHMNHTFDRVRGTDTIPYEMFYVARQPDIPVSFRVATKVTMCIVGSVVYFMGLIRNTLATP